MSCSALLSKKRVQLVSISITISKTNFILSRVEHGKRFITWNTDYKSTRHLAKQRRTSSTTDLWYGTLRIWLLEKHFSHYCLCTRNFSYDGVVCLRWIYINPQHNCVTEKKLKNREEEVYKDYSVCLFECL